MNLNQVTLVGRLTRDPEQKALPSGSTVTSFSVATSSSFTKDGTTVEETEYHNVVVFGRQAETCGQYLVKGQLVSLVGRLKTRSWESDGQKHYRTEIVADRVQFGPKAERKHEEERVVPEQTGGYDYPQEELDPNSIPF